MNLQFLINWIIKRAVLQLHEVFNPICISRGIRQKENCRAISHIWCGSQTHNNPSAIRTQLANILAILRPTTLWLDFQTLYRNFTGLFQSLHTCGAIEASRIWNYKLSPFEAFTPLMDFFCGPHGSWFLVNLVEGMPHRLIYLSNLMSLGEL